MSIINTDNSSQLVWVVASTLILSRILFSLFNFFFLFLIDSVWEGLRPRVWWFIWPSRWWPPR